MFVFISHLTVPDADREAWSAFSASAPGRRTTFPGSSASSFSGRRGLDDGFAEPTRMAADLSARAAARRLIDDKSELARAITAALYARMPELAARHGEPGRARCLEDMHYNLEHLAPAVDLGEPAMFASYVRWLNDLLAARNVGTDEVVASLEVTLDVIRHRFESDDAEAVERCLRAGLTELGRPAS